MKKWSGLLNLIMIAALVFCVVQINDLENQINNLRNSINHVDRNLSNQMNNIYNNVQSMLDEEANQLTISDWEYGELDFVNMTAEIICTVIPKEYNPDSTEAKLITENDEIQMEYSEGKYTVTMTIPMFEITEIQQVNLIDNGTVRTQELGWSIRPKDDSLLWTFARFNGEGRGTYGKEAYSWKVNGHVNVDVERKGIFEIKKVELVEMLDGNEINRIPVDISINGQKAYADEISKKGNAVPEYLYDPEYEDDNIYDGHASIFYPLAKEIEVPNGSDYILYADITDGYDLTYRCLVECISIQDNGDHNEKREEELNWLRNAEALFIFDKDGNVIYTSELAQEVNFIY